MYRLSRRVGPLVVWEPDTESICVPGFHRPLRALQSWGRRDPYMDVVGLSSEAS